MDVDSLDVPTLMITTERCKEYLQKLDERDIDYIMCSLEGEANDNEQEIADILWDEDKGEIIVRLEGGDEIMSLANWLKDSEEYNHITL